jgi:hypothetical protein
MAKGAAPPRPVRKAELRAPLRVRTTNPPRPPAAQPGKAQDGQAGPVQTTGPRHPARPGTARPGTADAKSPDSVPLMPPDHAAPEPERRPRVTAPLPDDLTPRSHAQRNAPQ